MFSVVFPHRFGEITELIPVLVKYRPDPKPPERRRYSGPVCGSARTSTPCFGSTSTGLVGDSVD